MLSDVTTSTIRALAARRHLAAASSTNGLVSVKLHKIRQALETELIADIQAIDGVYAQHAKQSDGKPVIVPGQAYLITGTPAYEADPDQADALNGQLLPIYEKEITLRVPLLTEVDAGWITSKHGEDLDGASLDLFTVLE